MEHFTPNSQVHEYSLIEISIIIRPAFIFQHEILNFFTTIICPNASCSKCTAVYNN